MILKHGDFRSETSGRWRFLFGGNGGVGRVSFFGQPPMIFHIYGGGWWLRGVVCRAGSVLERTGVCMFPWRCFPAHP